MIGSLETFLNTLNDGVTDGCCCSGDCEFFDGSFVQGSGCLPPTLLVDLGSQGLARCFCKTVHCEYEHIEFRGSAATFIFTLVGASVGKPTC